MALTDCSSSLTVLVPSGSTGEWSVGRSLAWEVGQSEEEELCWGAGVEAAQRGEKKVESGGDRHRCAARVGLSDSRDSVDGDVDVPGLSVIRDRSRSLQLPSSSWATAAEGGSS